MQYWEFKALMKIDPESRERKNFPVVWRLRSSGRTVNVWSEKFKQKIKRSLYLVEMMNPKLDVIQESDEVFLTEEEAQAKASLLNGRLFKISWTNDGHPEEGFFVEEIFQGDLMSSDWNEEDGLFELRDAAIRHAKKIEYEKTHPLVFLHGRDVLQRIAKLKGQRRSKGDVSYHISRFNSRNPQKINTPGRGSRGCGYSAPQEVWDDFFKQFE